MSVPASGFFEWQAANPLLDGIPSEMTYKDMAAFLAYDPADAWMGEVVPDSQKRSAAYRVVDLFVPTPRCVRAAQRLHEGLLNGLIARDPRLPRNRSTIYERAALAGRMRQNKTKMVSLPWFSGGAPGFVFSGSTGEGKSMLIERYLAGIPQILVRPANDECGWRELKQLVWLKVSMPANGGRLGLLLEITQAIDRSLGTDYQRELRTRGTTIDVQLVLVLNWLSIHCCGLLVIEEAQERTANSETFGAEFLTYFLKVLNWGIPTLLIGNPKALAIVESFAQDERRFSEAWIDFMPISDPEDPEWKDFLVPAIWSWRMTREPDEPIEDLHRFLWQRTGGHRAALSLLRRETIIAALDEKSARITRKHVIAGFHGIGFRKHQKYIASLIQRDIGTLQMYDDFPVAKMAKQWDDEQKAFEKAKRGTHEPIANAEAGTPTDSSVLKPAHGHKQTVEKRTAREQRGLAPDAPPAPNTTAFIAPETSVSDEASLTEAEDHSSSSTRNPKYKKLFNPLTLGTKG